MNLKTSQYKNAILIRSSQLTNMPEKEDILGTKVKDFHFEGGYDSLVKKLSSLFPELPPDILLFSGSGTGYGNHYKIDIPGNSSIRDILMHLSSNYRLPWYLEIQETTPIYTIKQSTGDIKAKGSNMILKLGFF